MHHWGPIETGERTRFQGIDTTFGALPVRNQEPHLKLVVEVLDALPHLRERLR